MEECKTESNVSHNFFRMANYTSKIKRPAANASRYTRKRRISTADSERCEPASAVKRARAGLPLDPCRETSTSAGTEVLREERAATDRVAETKRAARRPQIKPAQPRCLADGFSQGRLVIKERPRHRKKGGELAFQVIEAPEQLPEFDAI
uniref:Uncharacterized protein n=1 Tax=Psilocybe cubensis TaxID=181762 RepID=A0A8H8CH93_PSICU